MSDTDMTAVLSALQSLSLSTTTDLGHVIGNTLPKGQNERPWVHRLTFANTGTLQSFRLLRSDSISAQAAGFRSARVLGPFRVELVGAPTASASAFTASVVVALYPHSWGSPSPARDLILAPTHATLGLGITGAVANQELPFPPGFKDNLRVDQIAGDEPTIGVFADFKGYDQIVVVLTGKVALESMAPVKVWANAA